MRLQPLSAESLRHGAVPWTEKQLSGGGGLCLHAVQKQLTPAVYDFVINVLQPAEEEGHTTAAAGRLKKEERTIPDIIFQV